MTVLALNDKKIEGKNITVSAVMQFNESDMSGQSSATDISEKGAKAKELGVSMLVPFANSAWLTQLVAMAEAVDDTGARKKYRINNITAKALKIRQVVFVGQLTAPEQETINAWRVTFKLREFLSVPERKESRAKIPAAQQQSQAGEVTIVGNQQSEDVPPGTELTSMETFFKNIDDKLAPSEQTA